MFLALMWLLFLVFSQRTLAGLEVSEKSWKKTLLRAGITMVERYV